MAITVTDYQPDDTVAIDTYIDRTAPTTNYGTNVSLYSGKTGGSGYPINDGNILIRFDWIWNGIAGVNVPGGNKKMKFTTDLILKFYVIGTGTQGGSQWPRIRYLKRDWVESEVTWNNWKSGNAWQTAGGLGANDSLDIQPLDGWGGVGSWVTIYVSGTRLQESINNIYFGILISSWTTADGYMYHLFASSSNATAANRPKYTFSYEPYHKVLPISAGYGGVK